MAALIYTLEVLSLTIEICKISSGAWEFYLTIIRNALGKEGSLHAVEERKPCLYGSITTNC